MFGVDVLVEMESWSEWYCFMKDFFKTYEGEVIKVPTSKRPNSMYRIRFVDGDEEHVTAVELEELVKAYEDYVKQEKASFFSNMNTVPRSKVMRIPMWSVTKNNRHQSADLI